ncbi:hypothetical protein Lgra_2983 [Legionella gratiana]|uniref:Uncharacterized protein n=1 Tax=Legionella gratiana TaxID=45066 RepID=A0A378JEL6_9GAMM|nr:hypothetical protein [Legionella gratiana]KTD06206.1 hypothetical protein Lgra_2983 [Legionella gratiana]STX43080.1 Uncharacterised protein [Legionella gratiana]
MISLAQLLGFRRSNRSTISHENPGSIILEIIPDNSDFIREGSGLTIITGAVGQNVNLTIRENSSLKIIGNVGRDCKILKEGNGTLTFEGAVADDLELTLYGRGDVIFNQQPSEEVIRSIKNRGSAARVICAGMILPLSSQGYRHHNLGLARQPIPELRESTTSVLSRLSQDRPAPPSQSENTVDQYTSLTQEYIDRCHTSNIETIAARINKLNLTQEEEPLFEGFKDCIMRDYFDDIPVMYDERYYNLSTLLELYKSNKPDPYTRKPLKLEGFYSARTLLNSFDDAVLNLNKKREATKQNASAHLDEEAQSNKQLFRR